MPFLQMSRRVRFILAGGFLAFLVASFLPLWVVWHVNPWCGVGYERSLWSVILDVIKSRQRTPDPAFSVEVFGDSFNWIFAAVVYCIGGFLGWTVYFIRGRHQPRDEGNQLV
jgi:hypothetical protein